MHKGLLIREKEEEFNMWTAIAGIALNFLSSKQGQQVTSKLLSGATNAVASNGQNGSNGLSIGNILSNVKDIAGGLLG